ncbi:hypothetical protein ACERCG_08455, partial [Mannheimia sp. E30BD]|uniref:hypothetical protein n=1 Tax=Mannheimia sp. E30BD TaxID=3278708 RepID=UPI00359CD4EC
MKQVVTPKSPQNVKKVNNTKANSDIENIQKKAVLEETVVNWEVKAIPYNEKEAQAAVEDAENVPTEEVGAAEKADWIIYSVTIDPANIPASASGVLVPQLVSSGYGAYSTTFATKLLALGALSGVGLLGWHIMDQDSTSYQTTNVNTNKPLDSLPTVASPVGNTTQRNPTQENPTQENPTQEN